MRNTLMMLLLIYAGITNASDEPMEASPCPGLVSSYDVEKFESALIITDTEFASIEDCEQLGRFYFHSKPSSSYTINLASIGAIVDEIWQPFNEEAPFVLMEALLSWLKGLGLESHAESLRDFIDEYMPASESVQIFFTVVIWLIVIATIGLIVHEFYRAGMLKLPRWRKHALMHETAAQAPVRQWQDILAMPLREQLAALLQFSIEQLVSAKLLPASRSYTNRELLAQLETADVGRANMLREQIDLTEPVIYGDEPVTEERVEACRKKSRGLGDA